MLKTLEQVVVKNCGKRENSAPILTDDNGNRRDATQASSGDVWDLAEPTVKRQCGPVARPQTVLLNEAGRRVNYTKLLMEDWKIGSEAQLTSPPAVKRYKRPSITSD